METLKTVVLMTDGQNDFSDRISDWAYDHPSEYTHWNRYNLWYYLTNYVPSSQWGSFYYEKYTAAHGDTLMDSVCDAAKQNGIVVWAIGFEVTDHGAAQMENCASSPSHFFRVEGVEIADAFSAIAASDQQTEADPMKQFFLKKFRAFGREDGNMTVEFALWFPLFIGILFSSMELGILMLRHTMLERGLDIAVREVRINTGETPQHADLKQIVCDNAPLIGDCMNGLRLEMRTQNLRHWQELPQTADCIDRSEPVSPVRSYVPGQENELMVIRACSKFSPLFPTGGLAADLTLDGANEYALISTTAFVQEPR